MQVKTAPITETSSQNIAIRMFDEIYAEGKEKSFSSRMKYKYNGQTSATHNLSR